MKWNRMAGVALMTMGLGAVAPASAVDTYDIDPVHTQVLFFADHLGFSNSEGEFYKFSGSYQFDPNDWSKSSVKVEIETASLQMGDQAWDKHLKGADFFDVEKYPTMTFQSTKVEKTGDRTGRIQGELTLRGITKPVALEVKFNKAGEFPLNKKYKTGFSATGKLKRSEWGITYGLPMGLGDEVELRLEVEGYRK